MSVGVIIPALNEASEVALAVDSAFSAGADDVIVSDGGSSDATVEIAASRGALIVRAPRGRAVQMNAGAAAARTDSLVFLHADTILPPGACALVERTVRSGFRFGGFRIRFRENDWRLRVVERLINVRARVTQCPWGDQAQFVERDLFFAHGMYSDLPILEDYELARRMRATTIVALLGASVTTSGRRFLAKGVVATTATNWRIVAGYHLGEDPAVLAKMYR